VYVLLDLASHNSHRAESVQVVLKPLQAPVRSLGWVQHTRVHVFVQSIREDLLQMISSGHIDWLTSQSCVGMQYKRTSELCWYAIAVLVCNTRQSCVGMQYKRTGVCIAYQCVGMQYIPMCWYAILCWNAIQTHWPVETPIHHLT
jgi:hypothetical protein